MQIKLSKELSFIRRPGLKEFYIEHRNGADLIVSGTYSQNIKASEKKQILDLNILSAQESAKPVEKQKTSKQLFAEAKALKEKEEKEQQEIIDGINKPANKLADKPAEKL